MKQLISDSWLVFFRRITNNFPNSLFISTQDGENQASILNLAKEGLVQNVKAF